MIHTPRQAPKTATPRISVPADDDADFLQPQIDLLQAAFHLLFAAVTPKSSLHDMLAVSRVLSYTAGQYNRLLNIDFPPSPGENLQIDWDGIFERIWTLDLEHPAPFLPH